MTARLDRRLERLRRAAVPPALAVDRGPPIDPGRLTPAEREEVAALRGRIAAAGGEAGLTERERGRLDVLRRRLLGEDGAG